MVAGCYEQGYAGNVAVHGIRVRSVDVWTRCTTSHIQIDQGLACLNLLAMQPSTPISAYHHIKNHPYAHTHSHTQGTYILTLSKCRGYPRTTTIFSFTSFDIHFNHNTIGIGNEMIFMNSECSAYRYYVS